MTSCVRRGFKSYILGSTVSRLGGVRRASDTSWDMWRSSIWAVVGKCVSDGIIATFETARSQSEGQVGGPVELLR